MSKRDQDGGGCEVCGRSCLAHGSGACRACRRDKPTGWVATKTRTFEPAASVLTESERTSSSSTSWASRSTFHRNRAR